MTAYMGIEQLSANIQKTARWFVAVIGLRLVDYPLNALSWQQIILPYRVNENKVPFSRLLNITISGYAINYITPVMALGGEPYRILRLRDYIGGKRATSTVLLYAIMHILSHFVFWAFAFFLILLYPTNTTTMKIISVVFMVFCGLAVWFIGKSYRRGVVVGFFRLIAKLPLLGKRVQRKMTADFLGNLEEIDESMRNLYSNHRKCFFYSLALETLSRLVGCIEIIFILQAINIDIGFWQAIVISALSSLFANLLFFSPMQLGTKEGGLMLALKSLALPFGEGVYVAMVMRIGELFWIVVGVLLIKLYNYKPIGIRR